MNRDEKDIVKSEDVEGHRRVHVDGDDAEQDVEGHRARHEVAFHQDQDVEGHVQPPRDLEIER